MTQNRPEEIELSHNQPANAIMVSHASKSSYHDRKQQSKLIRVFTVFAYILSVSLAAIILSVYYIFMWEGKPSLSRRSYLRTGYYEDGTLYSRQTATSNLEPSTHNVIGSSSVSMETAKVMRSDREEMGIDTSSYVTTANFTHKDNTSNEVDRELDRTFQIEESPYVTTPSEENSTWLPEEVNDFDGDYNEFQRKPIFIKRLFGYHKARIK